MIELVEENKPEGIWAGDMKDGDIGVIVDCVISAFLGRIVQRYDNRLIVVGMINRNQRHICYLPASFRVRLLKKGEMLVVA